MKKTSRKIILRDIRGSLNRFLSILFIVALGSGFMAGLAATSPDMYETADKYMDENSYYDMDIKSTLGFTPEDAQKLGRLDCVETVQAAKVVDVVLAKGTETYTSRVFATLDKNGKSLLNNVVLKEGRMPRESGECVIQVTMGRYFDGSLKIGDCLTVSDENEAPDMLRQNMSKDSLTIVGFVESPLCIGITAEPTTAGTGRIQADIYTTDNFFTFDDFTDLYLTLEGARDLNTFGDDYKTLVREMTPAIEALGTERTALRTDEIRRKLREQTTALRSLIETLEKFAAAGQMPSAETIELPENNIGTETWMFKVPTIAELFTQTQNAIIDALKTTDPASGKALLESAKEFLADAEEQIEKTGADGWILRTRSDDSGFSGYDSNVGKVAALSVIFPVFFFMVALLVALTTMTRLIEEKRTQIGTLKSLGFTNRQILNEYLLYSLSSSVFGCILGFAIGFRLFPAAISSAYSMMFILPRTLTPFRPEIALWVAPITIGSILLATVLACHGESHACPAELTHSKAPVAGKRIWMEHLTFIWKRLNFTQKVTCRNLFRYKKRFFMTVIGVAGCSALLLTGFGLRDSIHDIVDKQFTELYHYDLSVMTDGEDAAKEGTSLYTLLEDRTLLQSVLPYSEQSGKVSSDGKSESITVSVPFDSSRFDEFITLRNRKSGNTIPFPENGVVLTEKLCETLKIRVGDRVTLENADGVREEVTVVGITENYIASYAYLSSETYHATFGSDADFSTILCRPAEGADVEEITKKIMTEDRVIYVKSSLSLRNSFDDSIKSINGVILVLILAAGLLCMVVLYNLTNVNLCERRKELATIRVLGFHKKEVEHYIFRETNILSFLGSLVGLGIGVWLHSFVVRTVEIDQIMFGRNIYLPSYFYAMLISMLFTLLVNRVMRRHVQKIDMVEAMKANE